MFVLANVLARLPKCSDRSINLEWEILASWVASSVPPSARYVATAPQPKVTARRSVNSECDVPFQWTSSCEYPSHACPMIAGHADSAVDDVTARAKLDTENVSLYKLTCLLGSALARAEALQTSRLSDSRYLTLNSQQGARAHRGPKGK